MIPASIRSKRIEYAIRDVVVPAKELEKKGIEVLKLNIGDPIKYDFKTPEHIRKAAAEAVMNSRSEYSPSEGLLELREAIVDKEKGYGVDITTDDIVVTTGVTEALMLIFAAALDPGQEILVPGPTYPPYITYPTFYDGIPKTYRTVEEDGWHPDPDDIRKKISRKTKAIAVINPNNPTGAYYDERIIREIADIAAENDIFMISDEIYDKMLYDNEFVSPAKIAKDVPMIILNGISKVYLAPGWRIGYLAIRDVDGKLEDIRDGIMRQARARLCANTPLQLGYLAALKGPQDHIKKTMDKLRERRDYVAKRVAEIDGLSVVPPKGAFYMFIKVDGCRDDKKFVLELLREKHVLTVHGSGFCPIYGKGHFRIVNLPPVEYLEEAFNRIEEFMKERKNI
ncbi:MAG: aminotransferase class I/II-fold pyridoxal phosphate-dependent enzyme [Euryarchaeota archaeon]|uniref:Aminotransferase n=1 Tax=uncultured euryarchaeote Alv-FOS4 TaxID=337893 RepID=Q3SA76_9EURY|nr:aspartate/tyrosine/aromatic aminotransferase [uncultured euryarchaeote Alv-FOS4]NPA75758.1 aminotransferase class I/II-fold pyridoxal phosphate-dependent enzyme [Euryarchaeota archaeon]